VDPLKDINAKHVTVIVTFLITTGALVALGKDVAAFVVVGLAVLGGIGVVISKQAETKEETKIIREQTNGTNTRLVEIIEWQARLLAQMQLPPELIGKLGTSTPAGPSGQAASEPLDHSAPVAVPSYPAAPGPYPVQSFPSDPRDERAA
jgi:hypothetical protein